MFQLLCNQRKLAENKQEKKLKREKITFYTSNTQATKSCVYVTLTGKMCCLFTTRTGKRTHKHVTQETHDTRGSSI